VYRGSRIIVTYTTKRQAVGQFRFADSYCAVWWKEAEFELDQGL
jgi:hypothetical protein